MKTLKKKVDKEKIRQPRSKSTDWVDTLVSYGFIIRGDVDKIKELKKEVDKRLEEMDITLVYQAMNAGRLWIKRIDSIDHVKDIVTEVNRLILDRKVVVIEDGDKTILKAASN